MTHRTFVLGVGAAALLATVLGLSLRTPTAAPLQNPERPAVLVGTWASDPAGDTLAIHLDGSAQRRGVSGALDFRVWRVAVDSTTHTALLCFESNGIGTALCGRMVLSGQRLALGASEFVRLR